jgi:hypothetical protein
MRLRELGGHARPQEGGPKLTIPVLHNNTGGVNEILGNIAIPRICFIGFPLFFSLVSPKLWPECPFRIAELHEGVEYLLTHFGLQNKSGATLWPCV